MGGGGEGHRRDGGDTLGIKEIMNRRCRTPCVLTISGKMASLVTTLTLVSLRAISSLMSTMTDGTFKGLTSIPHAARVALNITLKWNVLIQ